MTATPSRLPSPPAPAVTKSVDPALRRALKALFSGQTERAISTLEHLAESDAADARLHAYLGVAYATLAFTSPEPNDSARLRERALAAFDRALDLDPGCELRPELVPPKVRELLAEARRSR